MFIDEGNYDNAIKYFQLSYEGYKNSGFADYSLYGSAWCFGKLGEYSQASEKFHEVLTNYPESKLKVTAIEKIGECDFFQGDYHRAIQEFLSLNGMPSEGDAAEPALYYEGRAYEAVNLRDSAVSAYADYIKGFPSAGHSDEVRILLSKILIGEKGHGREALDLLSKVGHNGSLYFDARLETAHAYETLGLSDSAEVTLEE